eukprot:408708-Rhodomonas_salina.1
MEDGGWSEEEMEEMREREERGRRRARNTSASALDVNRERGSEGASECEGARMQDVAHRSLFTPPTPPHVARTSRAYVARATADGAGG